MRKHFHYNAFPITFERAQSLRKEMTFAEKHMWEVLRMKNLKGYYFRRQHPLGYYIADFYCHEAKLVIELDGEVHDSATQKEHDENRDAAIEKYGIKVLRFKNEDAIKNIHLVVAEIEKYLN